MLREPCVANRQPVHEDGYSVAPSSRMRHLKFGTEVPYLQVEARIRACDLLLKLHVRDLGLRVACAIPVPCPAREHSVLLQYWTV